MRLLRRKRKGWPLLLGAYSTIRDHRTHLATTTGRWFDFPANDWWAKRIAQRVMDLEWGRPRNGKPPW